MSIHGGDPIGTTVDELSYSNNDSVIEYNSDGDLVETVTLANGNIISIEATDGSGFNSESFTYDDKKLPFFDIDLRETIATIISENLPNGYMVLEEIMFLHQSLMTVCLVLQCVISRSLKIV